MIIQTYLINLDRDEDRLRWMQKNLASHRIEYERIPGVDGSKLSEEDEAYHATPTRAHLSRGEIGCILSHLKTWRKFLESDATFALVLEDDVHIQPDFSTFMEHIPSLLEVDAMCVYRLEAFNSQMTLTRKPKITLGRRSCYELLTNCGGSAAYILTRKSAERLLELKDALCQSLDTELFDPNRRQIENLKVYQWLPAPCIQDMLLYDNIGLKSNLAGTRSDEKSNILVSENAVIFRLKRIFRPLYTCLYDVAIWPKGKSRKASKFG